MRRIRLLALLIVSGTALIIPYSCGRGDFAALGHPEQFASREVGINGAQANARAKAELKLLRTVFTRHGNAAHVAWSDDGKALFLANEEGTMSAVKIDTSDFARPRIVATRGEVNFLWATDQRNGLLVFHQSYGSDTLRLDPQSFAPIWRKTTGSSHAIATDGSRIFLAREGKPGDLLVLDSSGSQIASVSHPDGWSRIYTQIYDGATKRLYITSGSNVKEGIPGGIYVYNATGRVPTHLGQLPPPGSDFAVLGGRLWRTTGNTLEAWDVTDPRYARRIGIWTEPVPTPRYGDNALTLAHMTINAMGTRLYVNYSYYPVGGGNEALDQPAGFMIFDVSEPTPVLLVRQDWPVTKVYRLSPTVLALSPDQTTLAVSYWAFGVRLYRVTNDQVVPQGMVATTGEAHDVYLDNTGFLHVFANDNIQIINPQTGQMVKVVPHAGGKLDGGWKPFKDGTVVFPGQVPELVRFHGGEQDDLGAVFDPAQITPGGDNITDLYFEDPYLYSVGESGTLYVHKIGQFNGQTYPAQLVSSVRMPQPLGATGTLLLGVTKTGHAVWVLGPTVGVAAVDVRAPMAPHFMFHDRFTFEQNGGHVGLVAARGRLYAGAGNHGVIIYDPTTFRRTGFIGGLTVDFLDKVRDDFLVVANYWYPKLPEGVYVYDVRGNPDAPAFVDRFPKPQGSPNFRARVFGERIYRVALNGVDILEVP